MWGCTHSWEPLLDISTQSSFVCFLPTLFTTNKHTFPFQYRGCMQRQQQQQSLTQSWLVSVTYITLEEVPCQQRLTISSKPYRTYLMTFVTGVRTGLDFFEMFVPTDEEASLILFYITYLKLRFSLSEPYGLTHTSKTLEEGPKSLPQRANN